MLLPVREVEDVLVLEEKNILNMEVPMEETEVGAVILFLLPIKT
jgi:hypothetical protein